MEYSWIICFHDAETNVMEWDAIDSDEGSLQNIIEEIKREHPLAKTHDIVCVARPEWMNHIHEILHKQRLAIRN